MSNTMRTLGRVTVMVFLIFNMFLELKASFCSWTISTIIASNAFNGFALFGVCLVITAHIMEKRVIRNDES